MTITPEIEAVIERLNQELSEIEGETITAEEQLSQLMSIFPDNEMLIQFLAYFQASQFFVVNSRKRINQTIEKLSRQQSDRDSLKRIGQDLSALLGQAIETKIRSKNLTERLKNLS